MKKPLGVNALIAVFTFIFLTSLTIYSQPVFDPQDVIISPFWDFYSYNYLNSVSSGKGFSGVASGNDISGFNINPASIIIDKKYQFNIQYTYKTTQPWSLSDNFSLRTLPPSVSAAFGYRISKNFAAGFVYSNPQSMNYDLGTIIRTDEFGNEIGRYKGYEKYSTHSFTIPLAYSWKRISVGMNLNYTILRTASNLELGLSNGSTETFTASTNRFNIEAGFLFKLTNNFSFGGKITPGYTSKVKYTSTDNIAHEDGNTTFPWIAAAGIEYTNADKKLRLNFDYSYEGTSSLTNLKNRNDFHLGGEYDINKMWTARAGFFTLLDYRKEITNGSWIDPIGQYDQFFITVGSTVKLNSLNLSLALMDSHISPGKIKNTYVNAGATYNF